MPRFRHHARANSNWPDEALASAFPFYRVKTIQRLSAAARRSQPPQGFTPNAYVTRLMASPSPISSSLTKPGRRTRAEVCFPRLRSFHSSCNHPHVGGRDARYAAHASRDAGMTDRGRAGLPVTARWICAGLSRGNTDDKSATVPVTNGTAALLPLNLHGRRTLRGS